MAYTPTSIPKTLGQRIKHARVSSGLSHDRLGAIVGTSRQHLIKLEKDKHKPRPEMLSRIAEATDTDPAYFADSEDDEEDAADPRLREAFQMFRDLMAQLGEIQTPQKASA